MELSVVIFLLILVLALFMFTREIFPLEISALLIMVLLVLTGILPRQEAFHSFGSDVVVLFGSLFVLISGLNKTGLIKRIEGGLLRLGGAGRTVSFLCLMLLVAGVSAFVSNTATLAVTIPIVVAMAKKFGESPRRWLMPVAFASVLGGMNSLIGTSANMIVSGLLPESVGPFELFTLAWVGFPILVAGVAYLLLFGPCFLPKDAKDVNRSIELKYNLRSYTAEVQILENSVLCYKTLAGSPLFREIDITVIGVVREKLPLFYPGSSFIMHAGDRLVVEGNLDKLTEITEKYGLRFVEEVKSEGAEEANGKKRKKPEDYDLEFHEVLVTSGSLLNGRSPAGVYLRNRYRISLIAINRQGVTLHEKLSQVVVNTGDILVVQFIGQVDNHILDHLGLVPLQKLMQERYRTSSAPLAALIFIAALAGGSMTSLPLSLTCLIGAIALVVFKILRVDEVYSAVEWKVLIFIGSILCLGKGMSSSGTATYLGEFLSGYFHNCAPVYALLFFTIITVVMTTLMSNQASVVVMVPLAISTAAKLDVSPMPFVIAVTIAASCCFMTPMAPAFMLVLGPGEYKFKDFLKIGFFLNVIAVTIAVLLIPVYWAF